MNKRPMKFDADYVRVYFNRAADAPKVWSVDFGPGTAELTCAVVTIDRLPATAEYRPDIAAQNGVGPDQQTPRAYFSVWGPVEVTIQGATVVIAPKITPKPEPEPVRHAVRAFADTLFFNNGCKCPQCQADRKVA